jgi:hypothetical protein
MITGYNTDVRHRGVVFHVQTEDKGVNNPSIESLIYVGGQILHRRRSEYAQVLREGGGKDEILELLEAQHRALITEITAGKLDADVESRIGPLPSAAPEAAEAMAPSAAEAAEAGDGGLQSLDEVILDYLNMEAEQEYLILAMDSMGELQLGSEAQLAFHAKTSGSNDPVADADIAVKLISTVSEPAVLGKGRTNAEGNLNLHIAIPVIAEGTAALIITASSKTGTAEIKHLI